MKKPTKKAAKKKTPFVKAKTKPKALKSAPKNNYTHVISIIDRSSSMSSVKTAAIGGFNEFLNQQKSQKEKCTMSIVLFNDKYTPLYNGKDILINDVSELTDKTYVPAGMTALYDAIGKSVEDYRVKYDKLASSERPDKVLVIILTDGEENSSIEYTSDITIKNLISEMKGKNWQFMFLCSTENAFMTGNRLGVSKGNTFKFDNTYDGNTRAFEKMSSATVLYRTTSLQDKAYVNKVNNLMDDSNDQPEKKSKK